MLNSLGCAFLAPKLFKLFASIVDNSVGEEVYGSLSFDVDWTTGTNWTASSETRAFLKGGYALTSSFSAMANNSITEEAFTMDPPVETNNEAGFATLETRISETDSAHAHAHEYFFSALQSTWSWHPRSSIDQESFHLAASASGRVQLDDGSDAYELESAVSVGGNDGADAQDGVREHFV